MLEKLSSQYYVGQVYIEPHSDKNAEYGYIGEEEYKLIKDKLYGETLLQPPLVMKIENQYILLKPNTNIPYQTTLVAQEIIDSIDVKTIPSLEDVFFPTKEAIQQFNRMGFISGLM